MRRFAAPVTEPSVSHEFNYPDKISFFESTNKYDGFERLQQIYLWILFYSQRKIQQ